MRCGHEYEGLADVFLNRGSPYAFGMKYTIAPSTFFQQHAGGVVPFFMPIACRFGVTAGGMMSRRLLIVSRVPENGLL
ncbi:hypothetical protein D3C78_1394760 [compost metagenome]